MRASEPAPLHLRPTAAVAPRALLPGDPGRALALAQVLLQEPKMFNHHRGLWGYTGPAADGELLTIQSTGMGGPSAAIVLEELIALGVQRAIRVGTCGALDPRLELGDLLIAQRAIGADGTSHALGASEPLDADAELVAALRDAALDRGLPRPAHLGPIVTTDLFYDTDGTREAGWHAAGAIAVEMEAAALLAVGRRRGTAVACLLTVTDVLQSDGAGARTRQRISDELLLEAAERMGAVALAALAPSAPSTGSGASPALSTRP